MHEFTKAIVKVKKKLRNVICKPRLVRQRPPLHFLPLQPDCRCLKIWKSISHVLGHRIVYSKIMAQRNLVTNPYDEWPLLLANV